MRKISYWYYAREQNFSNVLKKREETKCSNYFINKQSDIIL